jgi:hypothetical protein
MVLGSPPQSNDVWRSSFPAGWDTNKTNPSPDFASDAYKERRQTDLSGANESAECREADLVSKPDKEQVTAFIDAVHEQAARAIGD